MDWLYLIIAIALEVVGTLLLKQSLGFTNLVYGAGALAVYGVSFFLLSLAFRSIDVGVAYAIWSGLGTTLVVIAGIVLFREPVDAVKLALIAMIVVGAIGLRLVSDQA